MPRTGQLDPQSSFYKSDFNASTYTSDNGVLVLPVMGPPGTPPKIIQVHSPYGFRSVSFSYSKKATPPVIPLMANTSSGDVLLGTELSIPVPSLSGSQTQYDYTVAGVYEYVQGPIVTSQINRPAGVRAALDGFQTGRQPYQTDSLQTSILLAKNGREPPSDVVGENVVAEDSILRNFPPPNPAQNWVDPTGNIGINAANIDFRTPEYLYYDTGISPLFFSADLII